MIALLAALSIAASAADDPAPKPKELWHATKKSVELGIQALGRKAPKTTSVDWRKAAKQPWDFAVKTELIQDAVCEAVVLRVSAEKKLASDSLRRATAARTLRDFRKLAAYGWFVPAKLRQFAEGDPAAPVVEELFPLVMTEDEMGKRDRALLAETGLTADEYVALGQAEEKKLPKAPK